jgi:hypothetical protein
VLPDLSKKSAGFTPSVDRTILEGSLQAIEFRQEAPNSALELPALQHSVGHGRSVAHSSFLSIFAAHSSFILHRELDPDCAIAFFFPLFDDRMVCAEVFEAFSPWRRLCCFICMDCHDLGPVSDLVSVY